MGSPEPLWRPYIARLPEAERSYPECCLKGSVLRSVVDGLPATGAPDLSDLPPSVLALLRAPPLPNAWVSEVGFYTIMLALQERMSDAAYEAWVLERNRKLLRGPLYRVLFLVVSPERLFHGAANRWSAFRKGTTLEILELVDKSARFSLHSPPHLHTDVTIANLLLALRAAAEAAGAKEPEVRLAKLTPTRADMTARWR
jgi:hypothetical protein